MFGVGNELRKPMKDKIELARDFYTLFLCVISLNLHKYPSILCSDSIDPGTQYFTIRPKQLQQLLAFHHNTELKILQQTQVMQNHKILAELTKRAITKKNRGIPLR